MLIRRLGLIELNAELKSTNSILMYVLGLSDGVVCGSVGPVGKLVLVRTDYCSIFGSYTNPISSEVGKITEVQQNPKSVICYLNL